MKETFMTAGIAVRECKTAKDERHGSAGETTAGVEAAAFGPKLLEAVLPA